MRSSREIRYLHLPGISALRCSVRLSNQSFWQALADAGQRICTQQSHSARILGSLAPLESLKHSLIALALCFILCNVCPWTRTCTHMCQAVALKHVESRSCEAMMSNAMLQALTCLRLLPNSTAAASEATFIEAIERLQEYKIGLSPIQCLQVLGLRRTHVKVCVAVVSLLMPQKQIDFKARHA